MAQEFTLPGVIVVLSFILKLVVDRTADVPALVASICELPVDIAFLAIALVAGFTISHSDRLAEGMITFALYIVGAVVIVVLWRRSVRFFDRDRPWVCFFVGVVAYLVALFELIHAVTLLIPLS